MSVATTPVKLNNSSQQSTVTRRHPLSRSPGKRSPPANRFQHSSSSDGVNFVFELPTSKKEDKESNNRSGTPVHDELQSGVLSGRTGENGGAEGQDKDLVHINDLPPEILLQIFSGVHDRFGFRPKQLNLSKGSAITWYTPPLRLGLVSKYWLSVARTTFYASLSIHHPSRITPLYKTLIHHNPTLSTLVKRISICLPATFSSDLPVRPSLPEDEADTPSSDATTSPVEELRQIVSHCLPNLRHLEIANIIPNPIFPTNSGSKFMSNLFQTVFSSLTTLILTYPTPSPLTSSTPSPNLNFLLNLPSLTSLTIKQLQSTPLSSSPLISATPTTTNSRKSPKLLHLTLLECSLTPPDLSSLLSSICSPSLLTLRIEQIFSRSSGLSPTILSLPSSISLVPNLRLLKLSLLNYPILPSPNLPPSTNLLDTLLPSLPVLETLSIAGHITSKDLLNSLPPTLKILELNGSTPIDAETMCGYLIKLAGERRGKRKGDEGGLKKLMVRTGGVGRFGDKQWGWKVQKACWDANVVWSGWG